MPDPPLKITDSFEMWVTNRVPYDLNHGISIDDLMEVDHFTRNKNRDLGNIALLTDSFDKFKTLVHLVTLDDELALGDLRERVYPLNVINGTGSGHYTAGSLVPIEATATVESKEIFIVWSGDTQFVVNIVAPSTEVLMPAEAVRVIAISGLPGVPIGVEVTALGLDLTIEQGAVFARRFYFKEFDGTPVDLTSWTAAMHIREYKAATTALLELSTSIGGIVLGGPLGLIEIRADATVTKALDFTWAYYDLELYPDGDESEAIRFLEGRVKLSKEVTVL